MLYHRQGAGTFIRRAVPRVEQPLSRLTGFTEDMRLRGFVASSRELERGMFLPSPEEAMMLGVGPARASCACRGCGSQRRADGDRAHRGAAALLPDRGDRRLALRRASRRGPPPARALQRLRATLLTDADAALLGVAKGSPALYIQRIAYLADGRCVEFTRSYYRSDTYDFVSELTPARNAARSRP